MSESPPTFSMAYVLTASVSAVSVLVFCVLLGSSPAVDRADTVLRRGLEVYRAASCGVCHTLKAADTRGAFGLPHDGLARTVRRRFADGSYTGTAKDVRGYLRESLLTPDAYLVPEYAGSRYLMPAFTDLTPEDLEALITLLASP